jgi:hypothetical protein
VGIIPLKSAVEKTEESVEVDDACSGEVVWEKETKSLEGDKVCCWEVEVGSLEGDVILSADDVVGEA